MASGVYGLVQDQNSVVHNRGAPLRGKTDNSKVLKKGGTSGRKPLGDLSNSVKLSVPIASKKLNSDISSIREESVFSKITTGPPSKKKNLSNTSDKKVTVGGRKALSDISNSGKPHLPETLKKKIIKAPKRLGIVSEEPTSHHTLLEECFLHNHGECLKAQTKSMDLDEILKVVGINNGFIEQPASPYKSRTAVNKLNANASLGELDIEEMTEQLLKEEEKEEPLSPLKLQTSVHCKTPALSDYMFDWTSYDSVNFSLMETPKKL